MNLYIKLPEVPVVNGREDVILGKCANKRVLHLGCVDSGLMLERFNRGELMHQKLSNVATELWGVDIDVEGISYLSSKGFENLIAEDICNLDRIEVLQKQKFDVIVASEVIEHLQNPGIFLNSVKRLMAPEKTELIVTIPNAFRIDTLFWLFRGIEYVHPDHNYWFSYHTATNLLRKSYFEICEVYVYTFQQLRILPSRMRSIVDGKKTVTKNSDTGKNRPFSKPFFDLISSYLRSFPRRLVVSLLYKRTPFWGDGIIIIAKTAGNDC
jgi:SAM-dependent methyltransferase